MKNITILLILLGGLLSCTNEGSDDIDTNFSIILKDSQNNDLLDPNASDTYNNENIVIIYVIDGEEINAADYYSSHSYSLNYPEGYIIYERNEESNDYTLVVYTIDTNNGENTLYIQWNDSDTDTFNYTIEETDCSKYCSKVVLNGEKAWEMSDKTYRIIEIIK